MILSKRDKDLLLKFSNKKKSINIKFIYDGLEVNYMLYFFSENIEKPLRQLDLFANTEKTEQQTEQNLRLQQATLAIQKRYGKNALLKGANFRPGATTIERNSQIGGHRA